MSKTMKRINLGLIGFGVVGTGVYTILERNKDLILRRRGIDLHIKKIAVRDPGKERVVNVPTSIITTDVEDIINDMSIQVVVELVGGVDFPFSLIEKSLKNNKHIVTANKALLALKGRELFDLANDHQLEIGFEASVAGGIPIIRVIKEALLGDRIKSLYGIINGTSNYILTKMVDENRDYHTCLEQA
ncbi:MAG TPA: homoserine dehydrogenase, partial [Spirochaetes bacterium]|nr:homoserine dehydrogenase [Spirochaetota bacterium]